MTSLDALRRRAAAELHLPLRRRPDGAYVSPRLPHNHIVARDAAELRRVLTAWLAGRQP